MLSDEKAASKKITEFTDSDRRWMVAVRMVSEGVDVPAPRRRRLRHHDLDAALLRPGRRPLRARPRPAARPRRSSCRRCRACSASPPRWRSSATTCSAARSTTRATSSPPRTTCSPQANAGEGASDELEMSFEALGLRGPLRPGALRRRRVRPRGRGARRLGGGDGLPRHPRPARARPDARAAPAAAERPGQEAEGRAPTPSPTRSPR